MACSRGESHGVESAVARRPGIDIFTQAPEYEAQ